jgi:uncharacterized protein YhfF
MRDRLIAAVLSGQKTASSSLLADWQREGEPLPVAGQHRVVIDSAERPVAIIEIAEVEVIALGDADLRLAIEEGEGFASVAQWREAHERFWSGSSGDSVEGVGAPALSDQTPIVVERFELVRRLST